MKYSTRNLQEVGSPLPAPTKLIIEYRPGGELVGHADAFYASEEIAVDAVVRMKGWNALPGFMTRDVWVDGAF